MIMLTEQEKKCTSCGAIVTNIESWRRFDGDKLIDAHYKLFCSCGYHWMTKIPLHGCYCDLEPGQKPDGCVLDENRDCDCVYAGPIRRKGGSKFDCEYWRPLTEE